MEKIITLVVEIEGGVLQAVYGDDMPEGYKLNIVLRDMDNIESGDKDPISEGKAKSYHDCDNWYF